MGLPFGETVSAQDIEVLRDEFARLGWRDGANLHLDLRTADARGEHLDAMVREVLALDPAWVIASTGPVASAIKRHDDRTPIVIVLGGDLVVGEHGRRGR